LLKLINEAENNYIQDIDGLNEKGKTGEELKKDLAKSISKGRGQALGLNPDNSKELNVIMK